MDISTFAETEGANIPLPEEVEGLAEVIGRRLAVTIAARQRMTYVPKRIHAKHPLVELIGWDAARALSVTHSHMVFEPHELTELRAAHAAHLAAAA